MKDSRLYRIVRPLVKFVTNVFIRPKYIGLDNIPKNEKIILAGTHTHPLDCWLLMSSTKRSVHFLAKKELWKGPKKLFFANMGLIPVDRSTKDKNALELAEKCLNSGGLIGIFPEGTISKDKGLLPFKIGAVKMASDTNTFIVPFAISGKYRLFSRNLKIVYGKAIEVKGDLDKANDNLRDIVKKLLEDE